MSVFAYDTGIQFRYIRLFSIMEWKNTRVIHGAGQNVYYVFRMVENGLLIFEWNEKKITSSFLWSNSSLSIVYYRAMYKCFHRTIVRYKWANVTEYLFTSRIRKLLATDFVLVDLWLFRTNSTSPVLQGVGLRRRGTVT